ncbi:YncE family protein [Gracilibacillus oryzae]|uniref:YncE family protein n=1 Tax=Gracilibacillus oryzae TaxID=1672701 RepID=A0A7C8KWI9_9BACI|nr:YncE family protein [Gracilibacillus oryzae]KAB8138194.1 YncE family protein [Gracilibacillus oryzae]
MKNYCFILVMLAVFLTGCGNQKILLPDHVDETVMISHLKKPLLSFVHLDSYEIDSSELEYRITAMEKINHNHVILSGEEQEAVQKLNMEDGSVTELFETGKGVNGLLFQSENNRLYYSNGQEDKVGVVSLDNGELEAEISVGKLPIAMAIDPVSQLLYVVNSESSSISAVDLESHEEINTFSIINRPNGLFFDGKYLWVGGHGDYGTLNEYVYIYDPVTGKEVDRIKVGLMPVVLYHHPNDSNVHVICHGSSTVYSINIENRTITNKVEVDANPYAVTGDKQNLYVTSMDGNSLSIINKSTFQIEKKVSLADGPYQMILGEENE